jgi:thiamine biosynthesis lipoprotein
MSPNARQIFGSLACLPLAATGVAHRAQSQPVSARQQQDAAWTFYHEHVLGTSMEVTLRAASRGEAERAEAALLASIDRHDTILSAWKSDSELSRWLGTRGEATQVSPELLEVLGLFDHWRERTGGALDASAESAVRLWQRAAAEGRQPTKVEVAQTIEAMQQPHWQLDRASGTAMRLSDVPLALASFTKSYIAGRAVDAAMAAGVSGVMLNIGGDIVARGNLTQVVDLADPVAASDNAAGIDQVVVRDRAIATSGSYRRGFVLAGASAARGPEYSHIVDPRTALPAGHVLSSTVIARDPATAGALATAFSVMSVEESRALAAKLPGVEYLLITREGERVASEGWQRYQTPNMHAAAFAAPQVAKRMMSASGARNQGFELAIELELARIDDWRYRRPYVAVWVENEERFPVRTIALWFNKMRYLPDLRNWYRDDEARVAAGGTDITSTVSSATRSPGRYTLKWDGKDNEGKPVKPGKYTICIEVAREHGGTQTLRQAMDFSGAAQQHSFPAGSELGVVTLDYRKQ